MRSRGTPWLTRTSRIHWWTAVGSQKMMWPQCGLAAGNPCVPWFGEAAEHVRSVALVPLGDASAFGLLALGSEDAQRFFPDMGTLYLRRIGELCAAAATARL